MPSSKIFWKYCEWRDCNISVNNCLDTLSTVCSGMQINKDGKYFEKCLKRSSFVFCTCKKVRRVWNDMRVSLTSRKGELRLHKLTFLLEFF